MKLIDAKKVYQKISWDYPFKAKKWLVKSLQSQCIHTQFHWSSGPPVRFLSWGTGVHSPGRYLKGQSNEIFYSRFFTKLIILVSINMPKSDFEICRILVELFVLELSKNRLPAVDDCGESKTEPSVTHIFDSFEMLLVSSTIHGSPIFCFIVPLKERGVLQSFWK